MSPRRAFLASILLLALALPVRAQPEPLGPKHLLLLFNRKTQSSGELALYYARKRGVPLDQLVALDVPTSDEMSRDQYENAIVPALRRRLEADDPDGRIRCLVTFYGVPIRVGPMKPTAKSRAMAGKLAGTYGAALRELDTVIAAFDRLGTGKGESSARAPAPVTRRFGESETLQRVLQRYEVHRDNAARRILRLTDPAAKVRAQRGFMQRVEQTEGQAGTLRYFQIRDGLPADQRAAAEKQRRAATQAVTAVKEKVDALLAAGLYAPQRDEARTLIRRNNGLVGLLAHLDVDRRRVNIDQTRAAFDSELSLLWWNDYPRHAWTTNPLCVRNNRRAPARPVMMVSRLDGPSPAVVRRIIDESLAAERRGLTGKVYIDARGLSAKDSYGAYDKKLRDLARLLSAKTSLDVTLDTKSALFAAGACPQTALYCGWYSLAKYVDAFEFVPGAVGFHIASSEAVSLHGSGKRYWCKELLRDGVDATLGPVAEPYLHAFPDPRDFFGLLLTGRYALVECYYYTKPMNSWMMLLAADPLYRPFAANPQLALDDVFDESVSFSPAPATRPEAKK